MGLDFWAGEKPNKVWFLPCFFTENLAKFSTSDSYEVIPNFPNISSFENTDRVQYLTDYTAGDIVLWNGSWKVVIPQEKYNTDVYPTEEYTPIGVVVIPASHMYGGRARMIATRWMSCDDPENGSLTRKNMVWGTATDLTGLTNYTQVPAIARYEDESTGERVELTVPQEIYTVNVYAFLPSDYPTFTGETNPEDDGTRWFSSNTIWQTYNYYAPSPYASDGTPNPLYRATSYSGGSINNALFYFDGCQQTNAILTARGEKDYGTWKPGNETPEDFPAASCCDMYHTIGTSQGDWYLPSIAELGYVIARLNRIDSAMIKVNGIAGLQSYYVWSSTGYDTSHARRAAIGEGFIEMLGIKNDNLIPVMAFSRV